MKKLGEISSQVRQSAARTESPIEQILFRALMRTPPFVLCRWGIDQPAGEGYFFFPQAQHGRYRLDFFVMGVGYPPMARVWPPRLQGGIAVECDGAGYHSAPEDVEYDRIRDQYFLSQNIKTLRLTGKMIHHDVTYCVQEIIHALHENMKVS